MSTVKRHSLRILIRTGLMLVTLLTSLASVAQTQQLDLPDMGASASAILSRSEGCVIETTLMIWNAYAPQENTC